MSKSEVSHDIFKREIHLGDLVLLYNGLNYVPHLSLSHVGFSIGKNEYMVYDSDNHLKKTSCDSVYLLDKNDVEVSNLYSKMLNDYQDYQFKQIKSVTDVKMFKSNSKVHKPGDMFLTKDNKVYLYIGRYSLCVRLIDSSENPLIQSEGHTYLYLPDYILEALGDLDWVSIEGTLMSYYIPYHYYLNEHFLCFKKYSGRFVDYYQGDIHRKIVDDGKSFVQKTKFFKETWLPNNIEISLSPLN